MASTNPNTYFPVVIAVYIAWRVYSRVRRSIGRQALRKGGMITRIVFMSLITMALLFFSLSSQNLLLALAGGLVVGMGLAGAGLYLTKFEFTPEGRFYTPNPWFGGLMTIILTGRIAYRFVAISGASPTTPPQYGYMQSPLSLFLFGIVAAYYVAYYAGVLIKSGQPQV